MWRKLLYFRQSFHYPFLPTDTAIKVQAAKDKAKQANDTANDVLAQIKDLNQNLLGLRNNYSKLADDVAKTNAVVKDPIKNSKIFFRSFGGGFFRLWFSFHIGKWKRDTPEFHSHSITTVCWDKRNLYHFYFPDFNIKRILNVKRLLLVVGKKANVSRVNILWIDLFCRVLSKVFRRWMIKDYAWKFTPWIR